MLKSKVLDFFKILVEGCHLPYRQRLLDECIVYFKNLDKIEVRSCLQHVREFMAPE